MERKLNKGSIYYKWNEEKDDFDLYRFHSIKGEIVTAYCGVSKKRIHIDEFNREFSSVLEPDGTLFLTVVRMGPNEMYGKDVVISLLRTDDIHAGSPKPCMVCRQNVIDENATFLYNDHYSSVTGAKDIIGLTLTRDQTNSELEFMKMIYAHSVEYSERIDVYKTDKISDIMRFVEDPKKYNDTLQELKRVLQPTSLMGMSGSLEGLMKDSAFLPAFKESYNIFKIDNVLKIEENGEVDFETCYKMCVEISNTIMRTYPIKYDFTIDLNGIERDYLLVEDKNGILYVVGYDTEVLI